MTGASSMWRMSPISAMPSLPDSIRFEKGPGGAFPWLGEDCSMEKGEAFMFVAQRLEARVTKSANPPYSYIAKVNRKHPP